MNKKIIIIGGNASGMSAMSQARRESKDVNITLYEKGKYISYGACGIPYYISGEIKDKDELITYSPEKASEKFKATIKTQTELLNIDRENHKITLKSFISGELFEDNYDKLIITTGTRPNKLDIKGNHLKNIFYIRTLEEGLIIKEFINKHSPKSVLVIGSGHIGLDMVDSALKLGINVSLLDITENILVNLDKEYADILIKDMKKSGVRLFLGQQIDKFSGDDNEQLKSAFINGEEYPFDMVVIAAGTAPNTEEVKALGLKTGNVTGYICVSDYMRTSDKDIYAAGDCVEIKHLLKDKFVHRPLALTANRTGRIAGNTVIMDLLGKESNQRFKGILGTTATKFMNWEIATTGLSENEIIESGINYFSIKDQHNSRSGYYPGKEITYTKIYVDYDTSKLLGVQMMGKDGEARRINTFVTALTAGMTVEEIYNLDTAYAPPFSPVYDPVINICGKAMIKIMENSNFN